MKAVIPVAGVGTKLRPLTYTQPKPLIPVAGKPIISFIIDQLQKVGIEQFVFIIGYLGEKIREYVEKHYPGLQTEFVEQARREGSGHAIWTAREFLRDQEEIVIVFGDTIADFDLPRVMESAVSLIGVKKVNDPRNFGVVEMDETGKVTRVVEKPNIPRSNMAMVGFYKIREVNQLLGALDHIIQNDIRSEGEFPLTDAFQYMMDNMQTNFYTFPVNNWFDCGQKEVLLLTNAMLLDKEGYASKDLPEFQNTIIIQPVSIGMNCDICNAIIGPHVTIGDSVSLHYGIVKDTIIGDFSTISEVILNRSVIGNDSSITGIRQSLNIGDNTEIDFS